MEELLKDWQVIIVFGITIALFVWKVPSKSDLKDLRSEINGLRSEIRDIRSEINDIRSELQDMRNEMGDMRNQMGDMRNEINGIHIEIRDLRAEMKSDYMDLTKKIDSLNQNFIDHLNFHVSSRRKPRE